MKNPTIVQFHIQKEEEGGYSASAFEQSIFTQGETIDEVVKNIREAVDCHFDDVTISESVPVLVSMQVPAFA